jgi:hypothetical protein
VPSPVEAAYAKYTFDNRAHALIVIRYPEEPAAVKAAQEYGASVAGEAKSDSTVAPWRDLAMRNGKHTLIYQSGRILAIAPGAVAVDRIRAMDLSMQPPPPPPPPLAMPAPGGG